MLSIATIQEVLDLHAWRPLQKEAPQMPNESCSEHNQQEGVVVLLEWNAQALMTCHKTLFLTLSHSWRH